MSIRLNNISKSFGAFNALNNVSLDIKKGELIALLGPSGSGKTTLLRIIAGLEQADSGEVVLEQQQADGKSVRDRKVGFVFQHYALFRHMTIFENVAFGLRVREDATRPSENQIRRKVLSLLKLVHLEGLHSRYPSQLSGGQRQRVALARALAVEPQVLLLDEPFGALDSKVRKELRRWMRRLHDDMPITSVFVTHDQEEAMEVADRVVVMSNGRIEQVGAPDEVWNKPANSFVYDFLGNYNEFTGWKDGKGVVHLDESDARPGAVAFVNEEREDGFLRRYPLVGNLLRGVMNRQRAPIIDVRQVTPAERKDGLGKPVKLYARPHEMIVSRTHGTEEAIQARLVHINPAGPLVKLELERVSGEVLQADVPTEEWENMRLKKGEAVFVRPKSFRLFD